MVVLSLRSSTAARESAAAAEERTCLQKGHHSMAMEHTGTSWKQNGPQPLLCSGSPTELAWRPGCSSSACRTAGSPHMRTGSMAHAQGAQLPST